jgi:hypothetical protein
MGDGRRLNVMEPSTQRLENGFHCTAPERDVGLCADFINESDPNLGRRRDQRRSTNMVADLGLGVILWSHSRVVTPRPSHHIVFEIKLAMSK